jgi:hypothetical protein
MAKHQSQQSFMEVLALATTIAIAGCSNGDGNWEGGLMMKVHWYHYKDAAAPCHRLEARSLGKDPDSYEIEPIQGCHVIDDKDCIIYTGDRAAGNLFGKLVQNCFEDRQRVIDMELGR